MAASPSPSPEDVTCADDGGNTIEIGIISLICAVGLFSLNGFLSVYLALGLNKKLGVAALRCMIQLAVLGMLMRPIFRSETWIWVLLFSCAMLFISSVEVMSRPSYSYAVHPSSPPSPQPRSRCM